SQDLSTWTSKYSAPRPKPMPLSTRSNVATHVGSGAGSDVDFSTTGLDPNKNHTPRNGNENRPARTNPAIKYLLLRRLIGSEPGAPDKPRRRSVALFRVRRASARRTQIRQTRWVPSRSRRDRASRPIAAGPNRRRRRRSKPR